MAIPDYQTLMLPVLQLANEGEQRVADVVDLPADKLGLSEEERQELLPSASLADLMIEHGIGVRTSRTIAFRRLDEDFFEEG